MDSLRRGLVSCGLLRLDTGNCRRLLRVHQHIGFGFRAGQIFFPPALSARNPDLPQILMDGMDFADHTDVRLVRVVGHLDFSETRQIFSHKLQGSPENFGGLGRGAFYVDDWIVFLPLP